MKRIIKAGAIDQTIDVFIQDSSSTTGAGLTGLVFNSASLTCYYRKGATGTVTALTLVTQTVGGAHSDGGFVAADGTNMPGVYRLDMSDTVVAATGAVTLMLKGAANMAPTLVELQVVTNDVFSDSSIRSSTAQSGSTSSTLKLDASASAVNDFYNGTLVFLTGGTGSGQVRVISDYVGSTKIATIKPNWLTTPDATTTFSILAAGPADVQLVEGGTPETANEIADAVTADMDSSSTQLAAILADTAEIGTAGAGLTNINLPDQTMNIIGNITGNLSGSVGTVTGSVGSVTGTTGSTSAASIRAAVGLATANLDTQLSGINAKTTLIPTSPAAIGDAMTLTSGERNSIADAHLNRTDGIHVGYTPARTQRALLATLAGKVSKAGDVFTFRNVLDTANAITATTTVDGERTAVTVSIT